MKALAIDCGSSTLKFQPTERKGERRLAHSIVERIGADADIQFPGGAANLSAMWSQSRITQSSRGRCSAGLGGVGFGTPGRPRW